MLETFETVARAVADPTRIRILKMLEGGELCVCQITTVLDLAPATVSKHLAALKIAGLLRQRRDGKWVYYRLADRDLNPYAPAFLGLVGGMLIDDPAVAEDRRVLAQVTAAPLAVVCGQGRAALGPMTHSPETTPCCGGRDER
jgi:DNA-binding transcriptional ArsR family regulator